MDVIVRKKNTDTTDDNYYLLLGESSLVVVDSSLRFSGGGDIEAREGDAALFVPAAPPILMAWSRRMVVEGTNLKRSVRGDQTRSCRLDSRPSEIMDGECDCFQVWMRS